MARFRNNQSSSGKENKSSHENKTYSNNKSSKWYTKREFKFFVAYSGIKNEYTFEKIEEAIILKIQTTFEGVTVPQVITSLRKQAKHVFAEPHLVVSTETDPTKLAAEEKRNAVRYNKQYDRWETNEAEFNSLWVKAYGLI